MAVTSSPSSRDGVHGRANGTLRAARPCVISFSAGRRSAGEQQHELDAAVALRAGRRAHLDLLRWQRHVDAADGAQRQPVVAVWADDTDRGRAVAVLPRLDDVHRAVRCGATAGGLTDEDGVLWLAGVGGA